jgi:hypothetical protein
MKLSTVCAVMSGVAIAVNPWYAAAWIGLAAVNKTIEVGQDKAFEQAKQEGVRLLVKAITDQKGAINRVAMYRKLTGCDLKTAVTQLRAMGLILPGFITDNK